MIEKKLYFTISKKIKNNHAESNEKSEERWTKKKFSCPKTRRQEAETIKNMHSRVDIDHVTWQVVVRVRPKTEKELDESTIVYADSNVENGLILEASGKRDASSTEIPKRATGRTMYSFSQKSSEDDGGQIIRFAFDKCFYGRRSGQFQPLEQEEEEKGEKQEEVVILRTLNKF